MKLEQYTKIVETSFENEIYAIKRQIARLHEKVDEMTYPARAAKGKLTADEREILIFVKVIKSLTDSIKAAR